MSKYPIDPEARIVDLEKAFGTKITDAVRNIFVLMAEFENIAYQQGLEDGHKKAPNSAGTPLRAGT